MDLAGNVLSGPESGANPAGFIIHSAIHRARPEVACVLHTHSKAGSAVAAQPRGLLTTGTDVRSAFEDLYYLELACQIQIAAQAGGEVIECDEEIAEHTAQQFDSSNETFIHGRDWAALRRMLDRTDPSYAT